MLITTLIPRSSPTAMPKKWPQVRRADMTWWGWGPRRSQESYTVYTHIYINVVHAWDGLSMSQIISDPSGHPEHPEHPDPRRWLGQPAAKGAGGLWWNLQGSRLPMVKAFRSPENGWSHLWNTSYLKGSHPKSENKKACYQRELTRSHMEMDFCHGQSVDPCDWDQQNAIKRVRSNVTDDPKWRIEPDPRCPSC